VSESEFAFLALGLMLGAAGGAALVVVLRSRQPSREILLTVTHGAVPGRASTLSADAFAGRHTEPAPGGPADRRQVDRDDGQAGSDRRFSVPAAQASMMPLHDRGVGDIRTLVRSGPSSAPAVGIAIRPEVDPEMELLRASRGARALLEGILDGDHRAMLASLDAIAGSDGALRRDWEMLLSDLTAALSERAIDLGVLDFPIGTAFWDSFTIQQCRLIAGSLASMGFRFDGRDGWQDARQPGYRDLARALADVGIEARRVRSWPNQVEIADLYKGARAAPDDAVAQFAPTLEARDLRELLGPRADVVHDLWLAWDSVRPTLLEPAVAVV
jgi:hypothetical protein